MAQPFPNAGVQVGSGASRLPECPSKEAESWFLRSGGSWRGAGEGVRSNEISQMVFVVFVQRSELELHAFYHRVISCLFKRLLHFERMSG